MKPRAGEAKAARPADGLIGMTAEQAIGRQIMFAGNPETVTKQIMAAYDALGGFGHLIFVGRSGYLTHAEAEKSIRLLAKEVQPRVREAVLGSRARARDNHLTSRFARLKRDLRYAWRKRFGGDQTVLQAGRLYEYDAGRELA